MSEQQGVARQRDQRQAADRGKVKRGQKVRAHSAGTQSSLR